MSHVFASSRRCFAAIGATFALASACRLDLPETIDTSDATRCNDFDGDGFGVGDTCEQLDCDDANPDIRPGVEDLAGNGVDDNCDGTDGADGDGDGYASQISGGDDCDDTTSTTAPGRADPVGDAIDANCDGVDGSDDDGDGYASRVFGGDDCDDTDAAINPGASDLAGDARDDNCDGADGIDADGDGHASIGSGGDDCDDDADLVAPGNADPAGDALDANCDGVDGRDDDGDGYASAASGGLDCDDSASTINPGASDVGGDLTDDNCDGTDGVDDDGDGYASMASGGTDCDDRELDAHPGAADFVGGGLDENCDGRDGVDADADGVSSSSSGGTDCDDTRALAFPGAALFDSTTACMLDEDGDGFGDAIPPLGVDAGSDCDDGEPLVSPAQPEIYYDGVDQDCDYATTADGDQDADGAPAEQLVGGSPDCHDGDAFISPLIAETYYDGVDNDCDPVFTVDDDQDGDGVPSDQASGGSPDCDDEAASLYQVLNGYPDLDGDGHGSGAVFEPRCGGEVLDGGWSIDNTDCAPADADNWESPCQCEDLDGDGVFAGCDGYLTHYGPDCADGDATAFWLIDAFADDDGDGYGDGPASSLCLGYDVPAGVAFVEGDCAPLDIAHWQDCLVCTDDDGDDYGPGCDLGPDCAAGNPALFRNATFYGDTDGDGVGVSGVSVIQCSGASAPAGYAEVDGDCDPADARYFGIVEAFPDVDGDLHYALQTVPACAGTELPSGFGYAGDDCDDGDADTFPGAASEEPAFLCTRDRDGDGFGDSAAGGFDAGSDCFDGNPRMHPGAHDRLDDGVDQDCDGFDVVASEANGLFVDALNGVDSPTCGSKTEPCQTLGDALLRANGSGQALYVTEGDFLGDFTTAVSIFGSYQHDGTGGWTRGSLSPPSTTLQRQSSAPGTGNPETAFSPALDVATPAGQSVVIDGLRLRNALSDCSDFGFATCTGLVVRGGALSETTLLGCDVAGDAFENSIYRKSVWIFSHDTSIVRLRGNTLRSSETDTFDGDNLWALSAGELELTDNLMARSLFATHPSLVFLSPGSTLRITGNVFEGSVSIISPEAGSVAVRQNYFASSLYLADASSVALPADVLVTTNLLEQGLIYNVSGASITLLNNTATGTLSGSDDCNGSCPFRLINNIVALPPGSTAVATTSSWTTIDVLAYGNDLSVGSGGCLLRRDGSCAFADTDLAAFNACTLATCDHVEASDNLAVFPDIDSTFRPRGGSPVIDAGVDPSPWAPDPAAGFDFTGAHRPRGGGWDIGAFEQ